MAAALYQYAAQHSSLYPMALSQRCSANSLSWRGDSTAEPTTTFLASSTHASGRTHIGMSSSMELRRSVALLECLNFSTEEQTFLSTSSFVISLILR